MLSPDGHEHDEAMYLVLSMKVLEYMESYFLPCQLPWKSYGRTWIMLHRGQEVRSWTDYILVTDRRLFHNVALWDPRQNMDHYLVLGCLHGTNLSDHQ